MFHSTSVMASSSLFTFTALLSTLPILTQAHIAAFAKGMYCQNGTDPARPNFNSNAPVNPLYDLSLTDFWFQHDRGCDAVPPLPGVFLDLPAGGEFTVELAANQAFTTLSYGGTQVSDWVDGEDHPETGWHGTSEGEGCIEEAGYMHVQDEEHAQGTAFAISYESELKDVTLENLVVFSVLEHTPWKRLATYKVPRDLPECPEGGCTCAWLWVPRGCGQPNVYMQGFKCQVTGSQSTKKLAKAKAPVYCEGKPEECVEGAKQIIVWNQKDGVDNVVGVPNVFLSAPGYNERCGWESGAQDDIFEEGGQKGSSQEGSTSASTSGSSSASAPGDSSILPTATPTPETMPTTTPVPEVTFTATPTPVTLVADEESSNVPPAPSGGEVPGDEDGNPPINPGPFPPSPGSDTDTSSISFTGTFTGRTGKPTKFTCHIDED